MNIVRTGIILNTEKYQECVDFYQTVFQLKPMYSQIHDDGFKLTCFEFGESYLMVETGGTASKGAKDIVVCPAKLRFNVSDIDVALQAIKAHGIEAAIERFEWGNTINIYDPDGNRVGIRDEATFIVGDES
ncbi:MAG: VOC family protein [Anaerolineae bacterium]